MKIKLHNIFFLACVLVVGLFQACKKNDYVIKSDKDLAYVALSKGGFTETVMFEKTAFQDIELNLAVTTRSGIKKEFHAIVDIDASVLDEYNQKFGKNFQILPSSVYQATSTSVTIPAGTNTIQVPIQVNTSLLDDTKDFVLPVKIKSSDDLPVSKNFGWVLLKINKFKYEGVYKATGTRNNINADGSSGGSSAISQDKTITKIDATTYECSAVANLADGRAGTLFRIKINDDNTLTISGHLDDPSQPISNEGATSTFDPRTKAFTVNYKYVLASGAKRVLTETWTKK
jgi:uncharacterized protein DUF1735/uncharacterized protein DUF4361